MSLRRKPPAARASRTWSSMGRPRMGTSVFGISSVRCPRRLPRPAPMMMAFTPRSLTRIRDPSPERSGLVPPRLALVGPDVRRAGVLLRLAVAVTRVELALSAFGVHGRVARAPGLACSGTLLAEAGDEC